MPPPLYVLHTLYIETSCRQRYLHIPPLVDARLFMYYIHCTLTSFRQRYLHIPVFCTYMLHIETSCRQRYLHLPLLMPAPLLSMASTL